MLIEIRRLVPFLLILASLASSPARAQCPSWSASFGNGQGVDPAGNGEAYTLAVFDDGTGSALYVGGHFHGIAGVAADRIAKFDGTSWSPLGTGLQGVNGAWVQALCAFDDGNGPALYAAGNFTTAGGVPVSNIARFDGSSWSDVAGGIAGGNVYCMAVFDDGSGPALYAGGTFSSAGGVPAHSFARFDGTSWSEPGAGVLGVVTTLTAFSDANGPALFVGGVFNNVGWGTPLFVYVNRCARWNGAQWSDMDGGMLDDNAGGVYASTRFDDGTGPALYAGGAFDVLSASFPFEGIGRWNGFFWSPLGSGIDVGVGGSSGVVLSLASFDDGSGPALYAGGSFTLAGGQPVQHVARWNGSSWSGVAGGTDGSVKGLVAFDDGVHGAGLYAVGPFDNAGGVPSTKIARLDACASNGTTFCAGDGSATACPCGNSGAVGHGCANSVDPGGARLSATGTASLAADTLDLVGTQMPNAAVLYFQGTTQQNGGMGTRFGDGLRCAGGVIVRLGAHVNAGGSSHHPSAGHASISQAGQVTSPGVRTYQCWYRNASPFCQPSTFNLTNGTSVVWSP